MRSFFSGRMGSESEFLFQISSSVGPKFHILIAIFSLKWRKTVTCVLPLLCGESPKSKKESLVHDKWDQKLGFLCCSWYRSSLQMKRPSYSFWHGNSPTTCAQRKLYEISLRANRDRIYLPDHRIIDACW